MPLLATWVDLDIITLREVTKRKRNILFIIYRRKLKNDTDEFIYKTEIDSGLPWWSSGWESDCQRKGQGCDPWSGRIPHAAEQLSP